MYQTFGMTETPRLTMALRILKEVCFASTLLGRESFLNEVEHQ